MNTLNFEELCAQTVADRKGHIAELETTLKSNTLSKREAWYVFQLEITASKLIQLDLVSTGLHPRYKQFPPYLRASYHQIFVPSVQ